jgi:hypothetical protein
MLGPSMSEQARMRAALTATIAAICLVAVWLHWPALHAGLAADDYLQRAMLDREYPVARSPLDLYSFLRNRGELPLLMDGGIAPWWSHPALKLSLLRPLASLLLYVDHSLLGLSPVAEHAHSLLWLIALVVVYYFLARRFLPTLAALLATAMLGFDSALVAPASWICNRTALISATLGALALIAYFRHREDGWKPGWLLSALAFTLALAGGEYAVCAVAFVVSYELFGARDAWPLRLRSALAGVIPALGYLIMHVALNYGADGSVIYVALLDSPRTFLHDAMVRLPALLATELLVAPGEFVYASLLVHSPDAFRTLGELAVVVALAAFTLWRSEPERRRMLLVAAGGAILGLLPLASTIPSVRLLVIPSFGGAIVIAAILWHAIEKLRDAGLRREPQTWLWALAAAPLAFLHLGFSPMVTRDMSTGWNRIVGTLRAKYINAEIDDAKVAGQELVLFNAEGEIASLIYPPFVRHAGGSPLPRRWRALSVSLVPEHAVRISDDTLELSVMGGTMFTDSTSQMFRDPSLPFHVGDRVSLPGLDVTVEAVEGWAPTRVRYRFETSLDDPNRLLLILEQGRMRRVVMPPVGSEFVIPGRVGA